MKPAGPASPATDESRAVAYRETSQAERNVSEQSSWTCRPFRPGDESKLAALFERVFERPMTPQMWNWKHGPRAGTEPSGWLAVDSHDRPVCHYGGIPRRLCLPEGERTVMVSVDGMTAPEVRRQGAYTAVVASAHAAWRAAGVAFVLGLPNEQQRRIAALGWQQVASLRWMIRPLRPDRLLARRVGLTRLPGLEAAGNLWNKLCDFGSRSASGVAFGVADRAAAEAAFARLGAVAAPASKERLVLHRGPSWMAHRLLDVPESPYEVVFAGDSQAPLGYAACRIHAVDGRKIGAIAELATEAEDHRTAARLISETAARLRAEGAEIAIALAVPGSRDAKLFRRRGFLFSWGTFEVHAVPLDPAMPVETLRGPGRWALGGSDFDVI